MQRFQKGEVLIPRLPGCDIYTCWEAYPADSGPTKYGDMRRAVA